MQDATETLAEVIHDVEREVVRDALYWHDEGDHPDDEVARVHAELVASWELGYSVLNLTNVRRVA